MAAQGIVTPAYRRLQALAPPGPMERDAWEAYAELSRRRAGPTAPIPLSEIVAWCQLACIEDADARLRLARLVGALDQTWLTWARKRGAGHGS